MAGLVIAIASFIAAFWFVRDKLRGNSPEGNMFTGWFGLAFAGPAAMLLVLYVLGQFFPSNYFRHHPLMVLPLMIPAIWSYIRVVEFFFGKNRAKKP